MMKHNYVRAKCITGIYKDKEIEVEIGSDYASSKVKVAGKVLKNVEGAYIKMVINQPTMLNLIIRKEDQP